MSKYSKINSSDLNDNSLRASSTHTDNKEPPKEEKPQRNLEPQKEKVPKTPIELQNETHPANPAVKEKEKPPISPPKEPPKFLKPIQIVEEKKAEIKSEKPTEKKTKREYRDPIIVGKAKTSKKTETRTDINISGKEKSNIVDGIDMSYYEDVPVDVDDNTTSNLYMIFVKIFLTIAGIIILDLFMLSIMQS